MVQLDQTTAKRWTAWQKFAFRVAFVFFLVMAIPWNGFWYANLASLRWSTLEYRNLHVFCEYTPKIIELKTESGHWGIASYVNWVIILAIAIVVGLIWTLFDGKRSNYTVLSYWLRALARYRAGVGILGYGFTKLFPTQMPYPSIGILHTNFIDLTPQKVFWLSVGSVPWYESFTGLLELVAGVLLLFRKTSLYGSILLVAALGDIIFVNFAYDGEVHLFSTYLALFGLVVLAYDVPALYSLLIKERYTVLRHYYPTFSKNWQLTRIGIKTATLAIFIGLFAILMYQNFRYDPYKLPHNKGLAQTSGFYNVTEFRVNNKLIPYSPLDTIRWQDATFEKWSTLTFKVNKPIQIDISGGGGRPKKDIDRRFEMAGVAGGRRFFTYRADTINHILYLQNKNIPDTAQRLVFHYNKASASRIILTGLNENRDSLYVVLDRSNKKPVLPESTLQAGSY
ncbi:hypothetical protein BDD43_5395 [Mucilaginibacter gracilis]|uniref:DoxX-like protein n=1 Tax=Mucilaginibacter gracilis TaxID=423350 RepID=A0A495J833_9SPHI|nr:hypothetical protein [Mucilaginibacter gracilis]RKR85135.1 hypothetical protein BDD43_5395 [Mucilaginibacter gracilis]